ncbi:UNVERIFIED_CONTAM: hypothetical protein HDU68_011328 [Siphonaria sp. JEL0065]|nr:hypothetical protein HDU68_011328 [Siphonaria sp. JEL0065]
MDWTQLATAIIRSHKQLIPEKNQVLTCSNDEDPAAYLESFPCPVLAHSGTPTGSNDPVMIFANSIGLRAFKFENDKEGFFGLHSKYTAKDGGDRESREKAMQNVARAGYTLGYEGVRVAKDGSEFRLVDAMLWNVLDEEGVIIGQAALLKKLECSWLETVELKERLWTKDMTTTTTTTTTTDGAVVATKITTKTKADFLLLADMQIPNNIPWATSITVLNPNASTRSKILLWAALTYKFRAFVVVCLVAAYAEEVLVAA